MIDLQLHSTDSDGTWPWDRVLERCLELKLSAFALTDHDTIHRHAEIRAWAETRKAPVIPGLEMSTREDGQTVHLLGYFCEGPVEKLESKLRYLREARDDRNSLILIKLRELGCKIDDEDLARMALSGAVMGRPHIARLLLEKGVVTSIKQAFDRYLAIGGQAYFPKEELPLRDGIDLLHEAGAVASVAHPLLLKRTPEELEVSFKLWRSWGLDGLEGIYPTYTMEQTGFMSRMAAKYGFLITGGSDFHGENKPHISIGAGTGNLNVPDVLIEPLLERKEQWIKKQSTN